MTKILLLYNLLLTISSLQICQIYNFIITLSTEETIKNNFFDNNIQGLLVSFLINDNCYINNLRLKINYVNYYFPSQEFLIKNRDILYLYNENKYLYYITLNNLNFYRDFEIIIYNNNLILKRTIFSNEIADDVYSPNFKTTFIILSNTYLNKKGRNIIKYLKQYYYESLIHIGNIYQLNLKFSVDDFLDNYFMVIEELILKSPYFFIPSTFESYINNTYHINSRLIMPYFNCTKKIHEIKGFEKNIKKNIFDNNYRNNFYSIYFNNTYFLFTNLNEVINNNINIEFYYNWLKDNLKYYEDNNKLIYFKIFVSGESFICSSEICLQNLLYLKPIYDLLYELKFDIVIGSQIKGYNEIFKQLPHISNKNISHKIYFLNTNNDVFFDSKIEFFNNEINYRAKSNYNMLKFDIKNKEIIFTIVNIKTNKIIKTFYICKNSKYNYLDYCIIILIPLFILIILLFLFNRSRNKIIKAKYY